MHDLGINKHNETSLDKWGLNPMTKLLTHYCKSDFELDPNYNYSANEALINPMKPKGLWLSDDSDFGWKEWCIGEEFETERLSTKKTFSVDLTDICVLDSDEKINAFNMKYSRATYPHADIDMLKGIDWDKAYKNWKGILISPYSWTFRLALGYTWYYGWDCASACMWDLSCLTLIDTVQESVCDPSSKDTPDCLNQTTIS